MIVVKSTRKNRARHFICAQCKHIGLGRNIMPGQRVTEILLWVLLLFPGPIYSAWRHMNQKLVCAKCGHHDLIGLDTAQGDALFKRHMQGKS